MDWPLQKPKKNLKPCPALVDHYICLWTDPGNEELVLDNILLLDIANCFAYTAATALERGLVESIFTGFFQGAGVVLVSLKEPGFLVPPFLSCCSEPPSLEGSTGYSDALASDCAFMAGSHARSV